MKARVMIKGVTAVKKGRFNSQIILSVGDFVTAKMIARRDLKEGEEGDLEEMTEVVPIENKIFDWLSSLQNKSVVIDDD